MYPLVHGYKTLQQQQYEASVDGGHKAPQNTGTMGGIICCEFGMQVPLEDEEEYPQGDAAARCRPGSATGPGSNASAARCPQAAFAPPSPQPQPQPLLVPARAPAMPLMRPLSPSLMQPLPPPPPPTPPPQPAPQAPRALVTAKPQVGGYHQHPLGSMFFPGLDKAGVLELVKEVLCKPGFVSGPSEEKRLLRSIRSGLVDIQTMSRLLRWLRGERAGRELRGRGLNFVGPETDDKVRPVTTGMGMSRLMKEVIACGYPAGTQFVVGFSSAGTQYTPGSCSSDACSGVISGVLTSTAQQPAAEPMTGSKRESESKPESAPTTSGGGGGGPGGCRSKKGSEKSTRSPRSGRGAAFVPSSSSSSSSSPLSSSSSLSRPCSRSLSGSTGPPAPVSAMPPDRASSTTSGRGVTTTSRSGSGGGRRTPHPSRRKRTPSRCGGGGGIGNSKTNNSSSRKGKDYSRVDVVAHLFDEVPTHCRGDRGGGSGSDGGCVYASGGEGLTKMEVGEWAKIYGECEGPLLAAWVFLGRDAPRPTG